MVQTEGNNVGSCLLYAVALALGIPFAYEAGGLVRAIATFFAINIFWKVAMPTDT